MLTRPIAPQARCMPFGTRHLSHALAVWCPLSCRLLFRRRRLTLLIMQSDLAVYTTGAGSLAVEFVSSAITSGYKCALCDSALAAMLTMTTVVSCACSLNAYGTSSDIPQPLLLGHLQLIAADATVQTVLRSAFLYMLQRDRQPDRVRRQPRQRAGAKPTREDVRPLTHPQGAALLFADAASDTMCTAMRLPAVAW